METKEPQALLDVLENLRNKREKKKDIPTYKVPSLWIKAGEKPPTSACVLDVNPYEFLIGHIDAILHHGKEHRETPVKYRGSKGFWIEEGLVYNVFPRLAGAFDHNGDGQLGGTETDITLNDDGTRETGTFLKMLALLGHIKAMGCNVVYFLPITAIGKFGNKGDLGSPYAIRNPYEMDDKLRDPLSDLDIDTQFKALVEACHLLGMKVVLEFVFRTAAKDSDWIPIFPTWFYWLDNKVPERSASMSPEEMKHSYGNPIFEEGELKKIKDMVAAKNFTNLPPPPEEYRHMFKLPPADPHKVFKDRSGQYICPCVDPQTGEEVECRVPGAFADWPPDDTQPPWTDVTYLRIYRDEDRKRPRFNYIAYNTIRMYDTTLALEKEANRPLWDKISYIIPHYQQLFGVNGVMVDMGHAIPPSLMEEIMDRAHQKDPDFAFLSENFAVDQKSRDSGYNLVLGYSWNVQHTREGLLKLLHHAGIEGMPLSFFATAESHNTPRSASKTGGLEYSKSAFLVNAFIPRGVPFIHNGFELGESHPVNTGLDFTPEDLEHFKGKPLALFDRTCFDWTRHNALTPYIAHVIGIRENYRDIVLQKTKDSFALIDTSNEAVIAFKRTGTHNGDAVSIYVVVNTDFSAHQSFVLKEEHFDGDRVKDHISGIELLLKEGGTLAAALEPGERCLFVTEKR